uniref:Olfactory receptor n=1 Tax=Neogobius melanostomus TaxID=47308 RepID=A0A8C6TVW2_9GOBI
MENSTAASHFSLTMFINVGYYRYPAFVFCLLLYCYIVLANVLLIAVISREKSLHEPMYILIACLSLTFLMDLLSDTHLISRPACFSQIYIIYTFASYELTLLGVMAYDRYAAVCHPLLYHRRMTVKKVSILIALAFIYPAFSVSACVFLSMQLPLCGNKIHKVFCANWSVVKLSCVPTVANNILGMFVSISTVFFPLFFVLYTYFRIVLVCWKRSSEFKRKVLQNCFPHIVSFVTYSATVFCDVALSRYDLEKINPIVAAFLSLEFVVITPILNPLVYGLKLPAIRKRLQEVGAFLGGLRHSYT